MLNNKERNRTKPEERIKYSKELTCGYLSLTAATSLEVNSLELALTEPLSNATLGIQLRLPLDPRTGHYPHLQIWKLRLEEPI